MKAIDQFQEYLAGQGLRMTRERRLVVDEVCKDPAGTHFTVSELLTRLQATDRTMGRATVYRTIPHLLRSGLIFEVAVRGRKEEQVYENTTSRRHHDHLTCERCNEVIEFDNDVIHDLLESVAREHGYRLQRHTLDLRGLCPTCRKEGDGQGEVAGW